MSGAEQCPHEIRIRPGTATSYGPWTGDGTKGNSLQKQLRDMVVANFSNVLERGCHDAVSRHRDFWRHGTVSQRLAGRTRTSTSVPVLPAGYGNFVRSDWTAHVGNQGHRAVERCVKRRPLQTPGTGHALGRFLGFERTHERSRTKVSHPRQIALRSPPHTL